MKSKTVYAAVLAAAFALTAGVPAVASEQSVTITGSAGERQTDDGAGHRLRFVGDPAPAGYDGNYQHGKSVTTASPEDGPVTMSGTLDVSDMNVNGRVALIGLYDVEVLATGGTGHKDEAGMRVSYSSASGGFYDVGVTDGDAGGGEWVQESVRIFAADLPDGILNVEFVIDGTADPATCADSAADVATADGCMTLTVNGSTVSDSYGSISAGVAVELGSGAHPGWLTSWNGDIAGETAEVGVLYALDISPATPGLESKNQCKKGGFASFGFSNQGQCIASLQANPRAEK